LPKLLQICACLAAQSGHHELLSYCLDQGAIFDPYLNRAVQKGAFTVPMLELLLARNWWDIRSSPEAVQMQIDHFGEDSFTAKWLEANAVKLFSEGAAEGKDKPSSSVKRKDGRERQYSPEQLHQWFGDVNR
jgi:hypothetical protein